MGTEERHHQRAAEMNLKATLVTPLMLCLVTGAPSPYSEVQSAPQTKSVSCRTEYSVVWDTQYQEKETQECVRDYEKVCHTVTERLCKPTTRQECQTKLEKSCSTVYKSVCDFQWEGYGNNKVWAKIPGTCKQNPYDNCQDVTKTKEKQVAYPVCNDVPEQKCVDVPRQQCRQIPDQVCHNQPLQQCEDVPRQHCTTKHKKVPVRISKNVPKKVCDTGYTQTPTLIIEKSKPNTNVKSNKIVFADN